MFIFLPLHITSINTITANTDEDFQITTTYDPESILSRDDTIKFYLTNKATDDIKKHSVVKLVKDGDKIKILFKKKKKYMCVNRMDGDKKIYLTSNTMYMCGWEVDGKANPHRLVIRGKCLTIKKRAGDSVVNEIGLEECGEGSEQKVNVILSEEEDDDSDSNKEREKSMKKKEDELKKIEEDKKKSEEEKKKIEEFKKKEAEKKKKEELKKKEESKKKEELKKKQEAEKLKKEEADKKKSEEEEKKKKSAAETISTPPPIIVTSTSTVNTTVTSTVKSTTTAVEKTTQVSSVFETSVSTIVQTSISTSIIVQTSTSVSTVKEVQSDLITKVENITSTSTVKVEEVETTTVSETEKETTTEYLHVTSTIIDTVYADENEGLSSNAENNGVEKTLPFEITPSVNFKSEDNGVINDEEPDNNMYNPVSPRSENMYVNRKPKHKESHPKLKRLDHKKNLLKNDLSTHKERIKDHKVKQNIQPKKTGPLNKTYDAPRYSLKEEPYFREDNIKSDGNAMRNMFEAQQRHHANTPSKKQPTMRTQTPKQPFVKFREGPAYIMV